MTKHLICICIITMPTFGQQRQDPLVSRVARAERQFAERIYSSVAQHKPNGNLILAPYGIFESLTMLQLGARGETLADITRVTGLRPDQSTLAAFNRIRQSGVPIALQFGASVSDNDGYGVKIIDEPSDELTRVGIRKGDLIFTVDGRPVRTAREFMEACSQSTGFVRLDGFSHQRGNVFTALTAPLNRVRELDVEPNQQVINFASGLWLRDDFLRGSQYPSRMEELFGTVTFGTDFRSRDVLARQATAFFGDATGGRINRVDLPEQLHPDIVMMLMNAMAMDAKWQRRFQSGLTKPGTFESPDGEMQTSYMNQQNVFAFATLDSFRVVELPYRDTNLRMTVFLPETADGWREVESKIFLSGLELQNLSRRMRPTRVDLKLPKFDISSSGSLKSSIAALGLDGLFRKDANFTGIDAKNRIQLDDMRQQVYITTNEDGTRAGSVTQAVGILKSAAVRSEPFHTTRPFLFLIRDSNGVVYFAGRVTHPSKAAL